MVWMQEIAKRGTKIRNDAWVSNIHNEMMVVIFTFEDRWMGRKSFGIKPGIHLGKLSCLGDIQDMSNKQLNIYI